MDVKQVFTGYDCLNQAINSKFLGPLFKKGVMGSLNVSILGLGLGPLWNGARVSAPRGVVNEL